MSISVDKFLDMCFVPYLLGDYLNKLELKEKKKLINAKSNYEGNSALMMTIKHNIIESAILLIKHGADINIQDNKYGFTALMSACIDNKIEIVKLLLNYGANINIQNKLGNTALMSIPHPFNSKIEVTKLLLERSSLHDINIQCNNGWTALMIGCLFSDIVYIKLLLEYGADVNIQNIENKTALDYSTNIKCIKLLLQSLALNNGTSNKNLNVLTTTTTILSNINNLQDIKQLKRLTKFDYNSILLFELKKCVFSQA